MLLEFTKWPQSQLELVEALEQLRALTHGVKMKVVEACTPSTVSILRRSRKSKKRVCMSDWIGLAIIGFLVLCGLFGLARLSKPYDVSTEEFERRAQEGPGFVGRWGWSEFRRHSIRQSRKRLR